MARPVWRGSISFWMVNIPVRMFPAVREKRVQFHLLHAKDGARLKEQMICSADQEVVGREDRVRGVDMGDDQYVVVKPEELEALAPKSTRVLEILDFVKLEEIDPIYYDKGYYLMPEEQSARSYSMLLQALAGSGRAGITKFVRANKEYLAVLRPASRVFLLDTMHTADEVTDAGELEELPEQVKVDKREMDMALQIIDQMTVAFEPTKYRDEYRAAVQELVRRKAEGKEIVAAPPVEEAKVIDLMSALEQSLNQVRKQRARK
ncbi:MAG: non-homologous end joining protein Ku [Candidatus Geothermincolia bacterium]